MNWKPSAAVKALMAEVNELWPMRDKKSDGIKGDSLHAARESDHNPDKNGWVRACDIDKDLDKRDPGASWQLADQLRQIAMTDKRIKYIIHMGKITSGTYPLMKWKWRKYSGSNAHTHHIHISFTTKGDLDGKPFGIKK